MHAFAKFTLLAIMLLVGATAKHLRGDDESPAVKSDMAKYEAQLNLILRTRFNEEKAFVHGVIQLIRQGKLPRKLVDKSMLWVRNNSKSDNHSFAYFERVLRIQANRLNLPVPAFNYDIYDASNR
jgi:hypothetical protein